MIAVDTSALLAIIQAEPEGTAFLDVIRDTDRAVVSAVSVLEGGIVLRARRGVDGIAELTALIGALAIDVVPFDANQAAVALDAFDRYGKGIRAQARLNMGDCAAYALAKSMNVALLFKGNDFVATDLAVAAP